MFSAITGVFTGKLGIVLSAILLGALLTSGLILFYTIKENIDLNTKLSEATKEVNNLKTDIDRLRDISKSELMAYKTLYTETANTLKKYQEIEKSMSTSFEEIVDNKEELNVNSCTNLINKTDQFVVITTELYDDYEKCLNKEPNTEVRNETMMVERKVEVKSSTELKLLRKNIDLSKERIDKVSQLVIDKAWESFCLNSVGKKECLVVGGSK